MSNKIKYVYNPTYTKAQWEALNPFLAKGQVGHELGDDGKVAFTKVGPGNWNDLAYSSAETYPYSDPVTNSIGDVKNNDVLLDQPVSDIIKNMVSPRLGVGVSNLRNNASGSFTSSPIVEIGVPISTSVSVSYTLSNESALKVGNNIFVEAGGVFTNEGWFVHSGAPIELLLAAPLNPTSLVTYTINLYAVDAETGNTNTISTTIRFQPTILWGSSLLPNLSTSEIANLPNRRIASGYKQEYTFQGTEYSHIYIPAMLNPSNLLFSEVTVPTQPGGYAMIPTVPSLITVNNGTGTYDYYGYVSEYSLIAPSKMKID
jgi:hypothetical protein